MIGVNGNEFQAKRLKGVMEKEELNWRSFVDQGDINTKWNVADTPTYYVLDHKRVIRDKWVGRPGPGEKAIDASLDKLIQEAERDAKKVPK
jgi:hypothetical protein